MKKLTRQDTPSRAEIIFEWDIPTGDFFDWVCARMDIDPKEAVLGYKFDVDPKKSIIQLPPNDNGAFNAMLEKVKSRLACARTHAVILEIHDLVCFSVSRRMLSNDPPTGSQSIFSGFKEEEGRRDSQILIDNKTNP